ncbi:MAG: peptidoglycan-binding protein [Hyphomicrobiales bacterium]|nr:peptidoglycan-binding protein [Hyphomicrobiales bacterium]
MSLRSARFDGIFAALSGGFFVGGDMNVTQDILMRLSQGRGDPELVAVIAARGDLMQKHGINTPERVTMFLAQMAHESGGFKIREENLNYTARRMMQVWPRRFPNLIAAAPYAKNPRQLANKVYGGRMGNVGPDDGWKFRGRGAIQITGRDGYQNIGRIIGRLDIVDSPDLVASIPDLWFETACAFWTWKNLNPWADARDLRKCTVRINGGYNGYSDREMNYRLACELITAKPALITHDETLEFGDAGPEVRELQRRLAELRYFSGADDARFGKLTRAAVLAFQAEHDLLVDGRVGPKTRAALKTAQPRDLGERETLTPEDLKAAGSTTVKNADALEKAAAGTAVATSGLTALHQSGVTEWMTTASSQVSALNGLLSAAGTGVNMLMSNAALIVIAVCVGGFLIGRAIKWSRTHDAATGANLSR